MVSSKIGENSNKTYAKDDESLPHVRLADEAYCLGEGALRETYLNQDLIVKIKFSKM